MDNGGVDVTISMVVFERFSAMTSALKGVLRVETAAWFWVPAVRGCSVGSTSRPSSRRVPEGFDLPTTEERNLVL